MINGYITLDLTKDNVYTQATACLNADKPILIYDGSKSFYASFISIDNGTKTITVTAPNTSITITTANVVTATDTTPHLYLHCVDFGEILSGDGGYIFLNIYTAKQTNYTLNELYEYLNSINLGDYHCLVCSGTGEFSKVVSLNTVNNDKFTFYLNDGNSIELTLDDITNYDAEYPITQIF